MRHPGGGAGTASFGLAVLPLAVTTSEPADAGSLLLAALLGVALLFAFAMAMLEEARGQGGRAPAVPLDQDPPRAAAVQQQDRTWADPDEVGAWPVTIVPVSRVRPAALTTALLTGSLLTLWAVTSAGGSVRQQEPQEPVAAALALLEARESAPSPVATRSRYMASAPLGPLQEATPPATAGQQSAVQAAGAEPGGAVGGSGDPAEALSPAAGGHVDADRDEGASPAVTTPGQQRSVAPAQDPPSEPARRTTSSPAPPPPDSEQDSPAPAEPAADPPGAGKAEPPGQAGKAEPPGQAGKAEPPPPPPAAKPPPPPPEAPAAPGGKGPGADRGDRERDGGDDGDGDDDRDERKRDRGGDDDDDEDDDEDDDDEDDDDEDDDDEDDDDD